VLEDDAEEADDEREHVEPGNNDLIKKIKLFQCKATHLCQVNREHRKGFLLSPSSMLKKEEKKNDEINKEKTQRTLKYKNVHFSAINYFIHSFIFWPSQPSSYFFASSTSFIKEI
jgi:hypothetical protein